MCRSKITDLGPYAPGGLVIAHYACPSSITAARRLVHPEIARQVAAGFRAEGWRIFRSDQGRWWAQRRSDWHGNELYEHADADTAVRLAAKIRGVEL